MPLCRKREIFIPEAKRLPLAGAISARPHRYDSGIRPIWSEPRSPADRIALALNIAVGAIGLVAAVALILIVCGVLSQ
jgi:hypothetical protein